LEGKGRHEGGTEAGKDEGRASEKECSDTKVDVCVVLLLR